MNTKSSSVVKSHSYNPGTLELTMVLQSGATYVYEGVPAATVEGLERAESKGRYFTKSIARSFTFTRV